MDGTGTAGKGTFVEHGTRGVREMDLKSLVCERCGAPLTAGYLKCEYCGTRYIDTSNTSKTVEEKIAELEMENALIIEDLMNPAKRYIIPEIGGIGHE